MDALFLFVKILRPTERDREREEGGGESGNICGISISLRPHCLRHKFTSERERESERECVCVCVCVCLPRVSYILLCILVHEP